MYDELDYLSPEILNDVENKIVSQQQKYLLPIENNPKNWIDNEFVYVDDIKTIEDKIDDMRKFLGITTIPKRDWNLEGVNNISYIDINRWLKNLETLGEIKLKLTQISNNPLNIVNSVGLSLRNYLCYGNSYQESTPTPTNPIEIQTISGEIELKNIGKNHFNLGNSLNNYFATSTNGTKINKSVNIEDYVSATFTENSITITNYNNSGYRWLSKQITLTKNTDYTISGQNSNIVKVLGFSSLEEGTIGIQLAYIDNQNLTPPKTFNSGNYEFYVISMYPPTNTTIENLQIEEGTTTTEYEPYKELITTIDLGDNELVKIGDVADKLNVDELGNITITKNIGKIVLNGSENWQMSFGTGLFNIQGFFNQIVDLGVSNRFLFNPIQSGINAGTKDGEFALQKNITSRLTNLFIKYLAYDNVDDFKQWLSENNVIVYYQLATPTTIELGNINIPILQGNSYLYTNANLEPTNISCKYLEYDGNYKPLLPSSNLYPGNTLLPTNKKGE